MQVQFLLVTLVAESTWAKISVVEGMNKFYMILSSQETIEAHLNLAETIRSKTALETSWKCPNFSKDTRAVLASDCLSCPETETSDIVHQVCGGSQMCVNGIREQLELCCVIGCCYSRLNWSHTHLVSDSFPPGWTNIRSLAATGCESARSPCETDDISQLAWFACRACLIWHAWTHHRWRERVNKRRDREVTPAH